MFRVDGSDPTLTVCDIYCQKWTVTKSKFAAKPFTQSQDRPPEPLQPRAVWGIYDIQFEATRKHRFGDAAKHGRCGATKPEFEPTTKHGCGGATKQKNKMTPGEDPKHDLGVLARLWGSSGDALGSSGRPWESLGRLWEVGGGSGRFWQAWARKKL